MLCLIAGGLSIGQLFSFFLCNKGEAYRKLTNTLDNKQKEILENVSAERMRLYIEGQILGLIIAIFAVYNMKHPKIPFLFYGCLFIVIIYATAYLYYTLSKKSDYLLKHLYSKKQRDAWLDMYLHMKRCHLIGLVMGIISYIIFLRVIFFSKSK